MVQIIEENRRPSIGEQFGNEFAKFGAQIPAMMEKNRLAGENRQANELFSRLLGGESLSQNDMGLIPREDQFKAAQLQAQKLKGPTPQEQKFQQELMEKQEVKDTAQKAFNTISGLLKKGNVGFGSTFMANWIPGTKETSQDVGQFQSATGALEALLVDMVSKGRLSDTRFKYIKDTLLPSPGDRQDVIKGKLIGLAEILNLDPSALGLDEGEMGNNPPPLSSFYR